MIYIEKEFNVKKAVKSKTKRTPSKRKKSPSRKRSPGGGGGPR